MYIWQRKDWPQFHYKADELVGLVARVTDARGRLLGRMEALGMDLRVEAHWRTLATEVVKTSEIEGEHLPENHVRSSLARRLGLDAGGLPVPDRRVEGMVEVMLDATQNCGRPLTMERLCAWHAALFPTGYSGLMRIGTGMWRTDTSGPMRIVSGPLGREHIHYEAPPAARLESEMAAFLDWHETTLDGDPLLCAGMAHLWFELIHPFEDGNGRIGRAIAELTLSRVEGGLNRFYSLSRQIREDQRAYYAALKAASSGGLDITEWLQWFLECAGRAVSQARDDLRTILRKADFWAAHGDQPFNPRQRKIINMVLEGVFVGKLTSSRWARVTHCSQDTALRDISELIRRDILTRSVAGGRSTSYTLKASR